MEVKKTEEVVKIEETKESMATIATETKEPVKVEVKPVEVPAAPRAAPDRRAARVLAEPTATRLRQEHRAGRFRSASPRHLLGLVRRRFDRDGGRAIGAFLLRQRRASAPGLRASLPARPASAHGRRMERVRRGRGLPEPGALVVRRLGLGPA